MYFKIIFDDSVMGYRVDLLGSGSVNVVGLLKMVVSSHWGIFSLADYL